MGLNLSKGDMYKFVNYIWNFIKGKCLYDCSYCYMKQINLNVNLLRLVEYEFNIDFGCGRFIFIGSFMDMFVEDILFEWIVRVLDYCYQNRNMLLFNVYLLQFKNFKRFLEFINYLIMECVVFCMIIEINCFYLEIMNKVLRIDEWVEVMEEIVRFGCFIMVMVEFLMQFDYEEMVFFIRRCSFKLVNIGRNFCRRIVLLEFI